MRIFCSGVLLALFLGLLLRLPAQCERPNILLCITDDHSWESVSADGHAVVRTPAFDRLAAEGVWFAEAYATMPSCTPARASLLTGRHAHGLEHAGIHGSHLPAHFLTYQERLEEVGYRIGYTGKGLDPAVHTQGGRVRNPAGPAYNSFSHSGSVPAGVSRIDYARNFEDFLDRRQPGQPFSFWYGALEPHRGYGGGVGVSAGLSPDSVGVPGFLPEVSPQLRRELCDYYYEVEWADAQLAKMLDLLEARGELDNTIVIFTADNGMPYPRAKADVYDHGVRVPLAVRWGDRIPGGRRLTDFVSHADLAPTLLAAAGLEVPPDMNGRNLLPILESPRAGRVNPAYDAMIVSHEQHGVFGSHPHRALFTDDYLYIYNVEAGRHYPEPDTPALDNALFHQLKGSLIMPHLLRKFRNHPEIRPYWLRYRGDRPGHELYDRQQDPWSLHNLAEVPDMRALRDSLEARMWAMAAATADPRAINPDTAVFTTYTYYGRAWRSANGAAMSAEYSALGQYGGREPVHPDPPLLPPDQLTWEAAPTAPGLLAGQARWEPPALGKEVLGYRLYWLDIHGSPLGAPLAELCPGTRQWSPPPGTARPPEAVWLAMDATNARGQSEAVSRVLVVDHRLRVFPNPTTGPLSLEVILPYAGPLDLALYDPAGRVCWTDQRTHGGLPTRYDLHLPALPAGLYYLRLRGGDHALIEKIVVER